MPEARGSKVGEILAGSTLRFAAGKVQENAELQTIEGVPLDEAGPSVYWAGKH
jgi:hypothetical protein